MSESHGIAYRGVRARVREVVEGVDAAALGRIVPATPRWTGHDVLAHMVGVPDDVVHGRMDGLASDHWTQAQVDARASASVADLLAEWDEYTAQFEEMLSAAPAEIAGQAIFDAATHEHDLRHAIARPGARDSAAMVEGWEWFVDGRVRAGAPAIRFVSERGDDLAGVGEPWLSVRAPYFELFRAATGRRTEAEMAAYEWTPAPDPASILVAPFFTIRTESLGE